MMGFEMTTEQLQEPLDASGPGRTPRRGRGDRGRSSLSCRERGRARTVFPRGRCYLMLAKAAALRSVFWNKARMRVFTSLGENSAARGPLLPAHLRRRKQRRKLGFQKAGGEEREERRARGLARQFFSTPSYSLVD